MDTVVREFVSTNIFLNLFHLMHGEVHDEANICIS